MGLGLQVKKMKYLTTLDGWKCILVVKYLGMGRRYTVSYTSVTFCLTKVTGGGYMDDHP